mmetsp:Transcript_16323/g.30906  ORF Transcript_16323/g.30906 Transcript_16323/m.30906 type:complete len:675 (+) Transcript_16323:365-2389(+)|eukprot:CAMPEP_0176502686 /NCGR_PEP_ID=MMETSP0200_2-20121128/14896_1 /TAXON_ID=947934 /ORGANISM="Chaetoceros sp., Strain GSL56" /LENGTH=674 /DNA_ID=CAMNT_0017901795 /DNA_START=1743 /DNA_END=3767 /DNA_ORIENTATION=+
MVFAVYILSSTLFLGDVVALAYGSTDPSPICQPSLSRIRGGASDNDLELDTFIENLIAGVSDSNDEHSTTPTFAQDSQLPVQTVDEDVNIMLPDKKRKKRRKIKNKSKTAITSLGRITSSKGDEKINEKENVVESVEDAAKSKETFDSLPKHTSSLINNDETLSDQKEIPHVQHIERSSIYPPNVLQRFLLSQGFIGRVIAALTVLFSEVVHQYLPEVYMFIEYLSPGPSEVNEKGLKRRAREGVHSQYAAFASGSTIGGKKLSKDEKARMDAVALSKLKHVKGGVTGGKYAYLSSTFMKRYNLGKYADEAKMYQSIIAPIQASYVDEETNQIDTDDELETEAEDWVVQALCENDSEKKSELVGDFINARSSMSTESISVSRKEGMGINLSSMGKRRRTSVIDAARGSRLVTKTRKDLRIKSSDKDGGGGVLGRLRAVTASSGMSSRLLGAYPGDAVPITDAASRYGVLELAERYGYGDWSSDDEEEEEMNDGDMHDKKMKKIRKKKMSRPRKHGGKSISTNNDSSGLSVSFELGLSSPSMKSRTRMKKRQSTDSIMPYELSSRKVKTTHTNSNTWAASGSGNRARGSLENNPILSSPPSSQMAKKMQHRKSRNRVRRPMERTYEFSLNNVKSPKIEQNDDLKGSMKQQSSSVRAPMKRIRDHRKDINGDETDL